MKIMKETPAKGDLGVESEKPQLSCKRQTVTELLRCFCCVLKS